MGVLDVLIISNIIIILPAMMILGVGPLAAIRIFLLRLIRTEVGLAQSTT